MTILVTGSAGHLGEALMRSFRATNEPVIGLDIKPSEFTDLVGSICDRSFVKSALAACTTVIHTATLHKPHIGTHTRQDFIDTNITGTLNLLEEAVAAGCSAFVFTSTTSTFGDAIGSRADNAAVWVTEKLQPQPKNIYGATKTAAEDLCQLFHRNTGLPCVVLKTSRFFPEEDDARNKREQFEDANLKVNELLFRRVDTHDIVAAHRLAMANALKIGFDKLIISATTPFTQNDAAELAENMPATVLRYAPQYADVYKRKGWRMFQAIDRVYANHRAQEILGWNPVYTFERAIQSIDNGEDFRSEISKLVGSKGYHNEVFSDGPYPVKGF